MMTNLSVNINKIATLRNARGENVPDLLKVAADCETFGAQGITVHPRPDQRHIRRDDVYKLRPLVRTEFNIEGYPAPEFYGACAPGASHSGDTRARRARRTHFECRMGCCLQHGLFLRKRRRRQGPGQG